MISASHPMDKRDFFNGPVKRAAQRMWASTP
jgi:hypothetical protein